MVCFVLINNVILNHLCVWILSLDLFQRPVVSGAELAKIEVPGSWKTRMPYSYTERSTVNTRMILGSRVSHFDVSLISEGRGVGCWCGRGW